MKTLKITIALIAVSLLTVSGVKSDAVAASSDENPTVKEQTNYDLLAHSKTKMRIKTQA